MVELGAAYNAAGKQKDQSDCVHRRHDEFRDRADPDSRKTD